MLFGLTALLPSGVRAAEDLILDEPFEKALSGWTYASGREAWSVRPGVGRKGSSALVWECAQTNSAQPELKYLLPSLTPGCRGEATFWVKTEGFKGRVEGTIAWFGRKTGKWMGGAGGHWLPWGDKRIEQDADGWKKVRILTSEITSAAGRTELQLYMSRGARGRVIIDDLKIRLYSKRHVGLVSTSAYRGEFCRGNLRLAAQFWAPSADGEFSYVTAEGRMASVRAREQSGDVMVADVPAESFGMGRQSVVFTLKDGADGTVLGRGTTTVTRVVALRPRKSLIDEHQRLVVDGKPFFPIGMWWSKNTLKDFPDALDRYAKGPFNTLLTYDDGVTTAEMDRYGAHGLQVIVAVKDFFLNEGHMGCALPPPELKTKEDEVRLLTNAVRRLQNHPALLGWYTCDEIPRVSACRLEEHYRILCAIDDHIQFADTADHAGTGYFLNAADVVEPDPFWGQSGSDYKMSYIHDRCHAGHDPLRGVRASWSVADTFFCLTWDSPGAPWRLPNIQETRALVWIPISLGANGLMHYSYGQFLNRVKRGQVTQEVFDRQFEILCQASDEVRKLSDILLLPPGPDVQGGNLVTARTYADGKSVYLLVCNALEKNSTGRLAVKGLAGPAEPVFGEGTLTPDETGVAYDLPPLAVVLVRFDNKPQNKE